MYVVYTSVHDVQAWDCDMDFTLYIVVQTLYHTQKKSLVKHVFSFGSV